MARALVTLACAALPGGREDGRRPAGSGAQRLTGAGLLACALLLSGSGAAHAQTINPDGSATLWTATLTVVDNPGPQIGYIANTGSGSLTPDSFTFDGHTFRVFTFNVVEDTCDDGVSLTVLTSSGSWSNSEARWVLHVDSHTFDFADADQRRNRTLRWCDVAADDLGWTDGDTSAVKITRKAGTPITVPDAHPVIWQVDITPGSGDSGQEGWSAAAAYGHLTGPVSFEYKGWSYEAKAVSTSLGNLQIVVDKASDAAPNIGQSDSNLSLHIGSGVYPVSDSHSANPLWLSAGVTWPDAVIVGLSTSEPGAPGDLSATALSNAEVAVVTLGWSEPEKIGGSAITGYEYRRSNDGGANWGAWTAIANSGSLTSYLVTGLSADTTYTFQMRAANDSGSGLHSPAAEQQAGTGTLRPPALRATSPRAAATAARP